MPKVITSPIPYFGGSVTLAAPLNFPQFIAWQDALECAKEAGGVNVGDLALNARVTLAVLPGVLACVDKWEIRNLPSDPALDTFPATPRAEVFALVAWLIPEIMRVVTEAESVPNV